MNFLHQKTVKLHFPSTEQTATGRLLQLGDRVRSAYLHLAPVVSVAEVLQVGCSVSLDGREVVLQHVDDLRQLRVTPRKLPTHTGSRGISMTTGEKRIHTLFTETHTLEHAHTHMAKGEIV